MTPQRRALLLGAALALARGAHALPPATLRFPRDLGSHPDFRTEWWYVTGHAMSGTRSFGFQLTFFRSRVASTQAMQSRFAARQLLSAHAAITDVQGRKLWHAERVAREGFGLAQAEEADTGVRLHDWSLLRQGKDLVAELPAADFGLHLQFRQTQPLLLQGDAGLSRKGPQPEQASYYYSLPQLATRGHLQLQGRRFDIEAQAPGRAWLDHEWSQALLHPDAVGWDWIGMNLQDGSALTAFHLRRSDGSALWGGGSFRAPGTEARAFRDAEVVFTARRWWTSPLSQARYPVEWTVQTPAGNFSVKSLVDDQELDSRASTGAIYWEGLSDLFDAQGRHVGRGYLEMTGYAQRLRL